ncbi:subtilisin-like serine endopeptidase family protein [Medicago truncatula]|uniref:Subtilisin-like serine endopeptidase family protein n=1 Tax=Medicago truncatula TaxID=3880 RepID=A0A072UBI1_MEDTR|nr:subtilisin-like serine endopeptidase family protein [Medicago truncatula]
MDRSSIGLLLLLVSITSFSVTCCYSASEDDLMQTYIVYTGNSIKDESSSLLLHYENLLQQVVDSNQMPKPILQHYKRSFNGFVANLTKKEADRMAGLDGVVSVFPNKKRKLLTTKSWDFIGFPQNVQRENYESDVIVGVIDSGIWPESESFNDKGFSPPPSKWKGTCQTSDVPCNNKLIGAKYYISFYDEPSSEEYLDSPRDSNGHGTHTASIADGNLVSMVSMLGLAQGTIRGGVPSARVAVYKVCWSKHCYDANILAAFDDAIADGVDILSVSLSSNENEDSIYFRDGLSIGSFHAMKHGVLTIFAAGNAGPHPSSLRNFSPWAVVVAASTLDRKFVTKIKLGDNRTYEGVSLNTFDLEGKLYPIIYGGDAPNKLAGYNRHQSRLCGTNSLDDKLVKGKIVLCEGVEGDPEALRVGAVDTLAPVVASFSSRGPSNATLEILKPDLIAPGVDIIASWPARSPISENLGENRKLEFNIMSGTSMSCPHVSGAAAYLKSFHPTWSPAALRSALMTTAKQMSPKNNHCAEFAYGAGQIDPVKAVNPGLIYETNEGDYIRLLCGQGFNETVLQLITEETISCSEIGYATARDLNYPSFALKAPHPKHYLSGSFKRTVTNVGLAMSTYRSIVTSHEGLNISVNPSVLTFTSLGEKQTFVLAVNGRMKNYLESAYLIWDDVQLSTAIIEKH